MTKKLIIAVLTVLSGLSAYAAELPKDESLRIYLPREITVDAKAPTLGQVAILRGSQTLVDKADGITLGQISVPQQGLVITRKVVLSRLACSGIDASNVTLTGAEAVAIKTKHQSITGAGFAAAAGDYLKKNPPHKAICEFKPVRLPKGLITPGGDNVQMKSQLLSLRGNQCKVRTTAIRDGRPLAARDTVFLCKYTCRKVVAQVPITRGQTLSAENIKIVAGVSNTPEPAGWTAPYGTVARRDFSVNDEIASHLLAAPMPEVLLKRNQAVTIKIVRPGFTASAAGKALQDGAVGECIKVKNVDSQKVIMAKVVDNGTVEPIF